MPRTAAVATMMLDRGGFGLAGPQLEQGRSRNAARLECLAHHRVAGHDGRTADLASHPCCGPVANRYFTAGADPVTAGRGRRGPHAGKAESPAIRRRGGPPPRSPHWWCRDAGCPLPAATLASAGGSALPHGRACALLALACTLSRRGGLSFGLASAFWGLAGIFAYAERPVRPLFCRDRQSRDHPSGWLARR